MSEGTGKWRGSQAHCLEGEGKLQLVTVNLSGVHELVLAQDTGRSGDSGDWSWWLAQAS